MTEHLETGSNFLSTIIEKDLESGATRNVITRFPPEPNGFLHIGHAKSISVNFGLAQRFGGHCNLRFDDTNPEKESSEFIDAIKADVEWLGYAWAGEVRFASSYFGQLYLWAQHLIEAGNAYVCDLSADEAREYRGTLTEPGINSPHRERTVEENLALLAGMKAGNFDEGSKVLRARIDMASPNINMRDPILYRIRKITHHQTGDEWCIYPTYDFAHGQEDALEGVTHSICTLEFEDHRPLYDWLLDNLPVASRPRQYEFARLNVNYTITSKRKLKRLVDSAAVTGWDDPRMPTVSGMRRRGYSPASIRKFCEMVGTNRSDGVVDVAMLEHCIRDDLNVNAPRAMCVLNPLKVELVNYPEDKLEVLEMAVHPAREELGSRTVPFTGSLYIDREDFREEANKKFKRLVIGKRVRLRNAYVIEALEAVKDEQGDIVKVLCRCIEDTVGKDPADGTKPKGVIQWVSASHGVQAEVRLYDRLFNEAAPDRAEGDILDYLNPDSLTVVAGAWVEAGLANAAPEDVYQFEREGYFVADRFEHSAEKLVFNRTIGLRDSWGEG
ncbi:MAG: glutaminyl-tRNA synthetase [Halieaceae bacterium]|jgi:glutaminyl-tRNA synthetase